MGKINSTLFVRYIPVVFVACLLLFLFGCSDDDSSPSQANETKEIKVGALLSLTGDWSSLGKASQSALNIAVENINSYFTSINSNLRIKLVIEDTKLDTTIALEKIKKLAAAGIRFIIGPQSSKEVASVRNYANQNNIIVISQGSTAGTLAIPSDNIFRFCPSDSLEGAAIANLMYCQGIRSFIPLSSNDAGNLGLQKAAKTSFTNIGGFVAAGANYNAGSTDFNSVLPGINTSVQQQVSSFGKNEVGVYLTGFDEVIDLFKQALSYPDLYSIKWYGSDGMVLNEKILSDTAASRFAEMTKYPCPTYGLDVSTKYKWEPVVTQINNEIGYQPDAFGLSTYDALWVVALSYLSNNGADDVSNLKKIFVQTANSYYGLTGATVLNNAGDRKFGFYDYWCIQKHNSAYSWVLVGNSN